MSMTTWAAVLAIAFVLAYVLRESLEHLIQRSFALLYGLLNDIVQGLQQARTAALNFWHEHFGPVFGVRPLLGGLLAVGVWALLTLADFKLLMLTIDSLIPSGEEAWQIEIAGQSLTAGGVTALAVIALEFLLGMWVLDLLGVTDFFMFHKTASATARKGVAAACLAALVLMCAAQASLAIWRTAKMEEAAAVESEQGALMSSADEQSLAPSAMPSGTAAGTGVWVDRIPLPAMAMLNFFLPLAAAGAAGGIYPVLVGAVGVAAAIAVLLPLLLVLVVATLVRNAVGYAAEVVLAVFSVFTAPGRQLEQVVWRRPDQELGAETRAQGGSSGQIPAERSETTMPQRDASAQAAGVPAGPGAVAVAGRDEHAAPAGTEEATLADVIAALDRNPLAVSDEDLATSDPRRHNGAGPR